MQTLKLQCTIGSRPKGAYEFTYKWDMPVPAGLTYTQEGLLQKGFGEIMRDATSTAKGTNASGLAIDPTPDDRNKAGKDRLEKLKAGIYTFGGGSGTTLHDDAWIRFFRASDHKESGKPITSRNLDQAKHSYARMIILAEDNTLRGKDLEDAINIHKSTIWELQEANTEIGGVGYFIQEIKDEITRKQAEKQASKTIKLTGFSLKPSK